MRQSVISTKLLGVIKHNYGGSNRARLRNCNSVTAGFKKGWALLQIFGAPFITEIQVHILLQILKLQMGHRNPSDGHFAAHGVVVRHPCSTTALPDPVKPHIF